MNKTLAAATGFALRRWSSAKLAALNLAVEYGTVPVENVAFKDAVDQHLLKPDGRPHDMETLKAALTNEVNSRVEAGTFS